MGLRVESNDWRGKDLKDCAWIQDHDTERDYSQTEHRKNALVVGNGGDGENSLAMHMEQWHVTDCLDLSDLIGPSDKRDAAIGQTFT
jgi:hypothetical protein